MVAKLFRRLLANTFNTYRDVNFIADTVQHEVHSKLTALNGEGRFKPTPKVIPWVFTCTGIAGFYGNWTGFP